MKMNYIHRSTLLALLFMMLSVPMLQAQNPGAPDDGDGTNEPAIPIDGGISLLLAAGAIYGGKKLHQLKKTNVTDSDRGAK